MRTVFKWRFTNAIFDWLIDWLMDWLAHADQLSRPRLQSTADYDLFKESIFGTSKGTNTGHIIIIECHKQLSWVIPVHRRRTTWNECPSNDRDQTMLWIFHSNTSRRRGNIADSFSQQCVHWQHNSAQHDLNPHSAKYKIYKINEYQPDMCTCANNFQKSTQKTHLCIQSYYST